MAVHPLVSISFICAFAASVIVVYGTWRCKHPGFKDPLTHTLIGPDSWKSFTDGWGFSHFVFFAILTFLFPEYYHVIFVMGVSWEIIESISKSKPFYLSECHVSVDTDQQAGWWYGRWQDVVMNTLGQLTGYGLLQANAPGWVFGVLYALVIGRAVSI